MASSRRTHRRREQRSFQRHQLRLEGLEKRYALDAASLLDPSSYEPGSLLVKLKDPVVDSLQSQSSGDAVFGISSRSALAPTVDPLAGLPTSVSDVLAGYGASGFGRVFPSVSGAGQDDTLFGISSLSTRSTTPTSSTPEDTAAWEIGLDRWVRIDLPEDADLEAIMASLEDDSSIAAVEPDFLFRLSGAESPTSVESQSFTAASIPTDSSDPAMSSQWHLDAINAPQAWSYLESEGLPAGGASDIVVAVIDTGVDYTHEDLAANMWVNTQEIAGNGIDDDGNGFIDDIHGVAVVSDYRSHSGDPMDDHAHGTHVAGVVAASANNDLGGVGVAYNSKIMAIKALQYSGVGASTDIAEAIYYAVENGADIINMSFGSYSESRILRDALEVAFGQCVLVAAAGNNGLPTECPPFKPMYPAAYNWVLGVEASNSLGTKAGFSNYDCVQYTRYEYEVRAPGVDVYSSLPNNQYAAWDGTSMAAPAVSGLAALLRTKFFNKDLYSSRFIMGQVAAVSTDAGGVAVIDAVHALTNTPKPNLTLLDYWVFDTATQDADNDDDGRVDAGETIDLAIALKNRWGKAEDVTVTLDAWAPSAVAPDPYVTISNSTVNYGAVGSFNEDDNGLTYDADGVITGVNVPFTFTTLSDTPNNHVIPFRLTITARNGLDPDDQTVFSWTERFFITVQRGRELPRFISEDMTLTKDDFWIVNGPTRIESGVTLTIGPGTHVQFGSHPSNDPYATDPRSTYIANGGTLLVLGTVESPVHLFPLYREGEHGDAVYPTHNSLVKINGGTTRIEFADIINLDSSPNTIAYDSTFSHYMGQGSSVSFSHVERCAFLGVELGLRPAGVQQSEANFVENLIDVGWFYAWHATMSVHDNVFLADVDAQGYFDPYQPGSWDLRWQGSQVSNNAFLNPYWKTGVLPLLIRPEDSGDIDATNNYWGTTNHTLIDRVAYDWHDDFSLGRVTYDPLLETAPESAYPFVADVVLSTDAGSDVLQVGTEPVTFTVTYNRDMDTSIQPQISFGPDQPVTDYTVHPIDGGWQDARTWVGVFKVNPLTGDGYQLIRTAGARAADKTWLETAVDKGRFRFEIITSGAESMNLQANGAPGRVELSWIQDDFDLLAGYNVYRSTTTDGTYQRVNSTLIPAATKAFVDSTVQPGNTYFYTFRVAQTDGSESEDSNVASAAVLAPDTTPPVINHTPASTAAPNSSFTIRADVTDNEGISGVTLHYRQAGTSQFAQVGMTHTTNDRYSVTLPGSVMIAPGVEYFIVATDGSNSVSEGSSASPHQLSIASDSSTVVTGDLAGVLNGGIAMGHFGWQDINGVTQDNVSVASAGVHGRVSLLSLGGNEWAWTYVAGSTFAGTDSFTLRMIDDLGYSTDQAFVVTGTSVPNSITWTMILHQNLVASLSTYSIPALDVFGQQVNGGVTQITATSSNGSLIQNPSTIYTETNVPSSITFTPSVNGIGATTLTIQVEDGGPDNDFITTEDNRQATHRVEVTVLQIISNSGSAILAKDSSESLYVNTQPVIYNQQQVPQAIFGSSVVSADTSDSENALMLKPLGADAEDPPTHRLLTDETWRINGIFNSLKNASSPVLDLSGREVSGPLNIAAVAGAYVINGVNNPMLVVRRGQTYTFNLNTGVHRFWLQTTGSGYQSANVYDSEFTGNSQTTGEHQWVVPQDAPDEIFYQCEFHPVMFGKIIVVD